MAANSKVTVGVVGLGIWGQNHPLVYDDYHRSELKVVCDLDEGRAKEIAAKYRCDWTTSVEELASSDIEAFSVATPDPYHFEPTRALLEAGKHVLVEKPLTTDLGEAKQLAELAQKSDGFSMVDYQLRWDPQWGLIKDTVERGELGPLTMAYFRLSDAIDVAENWLAWAGKSGPHWFLFPHTMDLMRWIAGGEEPGTVFAMGHKGVLASKGVNTWDSIQALVSFGDLHATFETSWIVPNSNPSVLDCHMTLNGANGKIDFDSDYSGLAIATQRYSYPWVPVGQRDRYGKLNHYLYEPMRYFIDCVADGITPECTFNDGLIGVAMVQAVVQSLETGEPVAVSDLL